MTPPRFSIVIPTRDRREVVVRHVTALEHQRLRDFEVIVVVDGDRDGTADALRGLSVGFPLRVIDQSNQGAGHARNTGAAAAQGDLVLFLDDDMEADPGLLAEHERLHRAGVDVVFGDLPLHPGSPRNLLSWGVGRWAEHRRRRLTEPGAQLTPDDLLTGQMSLARARFAALGGFDEAFTRAGLFGGEDIDLGTRLRASGARMAFSPAAISYQFYDVRPHDYLRRNREAGRSDAELVLKHPEERARLANGPQFRTRRTRWVLGPLVLAPHVLTRPVAAAAVALVNTGRTGERARRLFFAVRTLEHQRGMRAVHRGARRRRVAVLAYHAIADLRDDRILEQYGVPPALLAAQLDTLARRGWRFVDLDEFLSILRGAPAPGSRTVLVTFDDAYADLLEACRDILAPREIPAVVFAVAGRLGQANVWDRHLGARSLALLDADGLRAVAHGGVEIGSHTASHPMLTQCAGDRLEAELEGSATALADLGLPRPRALAYPYGDCDPAVATAARAAGYDVAFTVTPGVVHPGADRWQLPRLEVMRRDNPGRLRLRLTALRLPERWRGRALALLDRLPQRPGRDGARPR